MIKYIKGNIFDSDSQTIVNTVNCVGVMGKGIALTFKNKYPEMFKVYKNICTKKQLKPGMLHLYTKEDKWILNFPTKNHWKNKSEISYLEDGLQKFVDTYKQKGITSISFPQLGCANGGLDWETQVKPLMERYLSNLEDVEIIIYLYE